MNYRDHPFHSFGTGKKETLSNPNIRQILIQFYESNYSSDIMKLVILCNKPLDDLKALFLSTFSDTPKLSRDLIQIRENNFNLKNSKSIKAYTQQQLNKIYYMNPIKDLHEFHLYFPFSAFQNDYYNYESRPFFFVRYFLKQKGPGSLCFYLKQQGLITSLSVAAPSRKTFDLEMFKVKFLLTDFGISNFKRLIVYFFQYLNIVKECRMETVLLYFEELKKIQGLKWRFLEKSKGSEGVVTRYSEFLSAYYGVIPNEKILEHRKLVWRFDEGEWKRILNETLSFSNLFVFLISKISFARLVSLQDSSNNSANSSSNLVLKHEKWYNIPFFEQNFDDASISDPNLSLNQNLEENSNHFSLPPFNEYIPEKFDLVPVTPESTASPYPQLLVSEKHCKLFWKQDTQFSSPKIMMRMLITNPIVEVSMRNRILSELLASILSDSLSETLYTEKLSGFHFEFGTNIHGMEVLIWGYSDKFCNLVRKILTQNFFSENSGSKNPEGSSLKIFENISEMKVEDFKSKKIRALQNTKLEQPYSLANQELARLLTCSFSDISSDIDYIEQKIKLVSYITKLDLMNFFSEMFYNTFWKLKMIVIGNISKNETLQFFNRLKEETTMLSFSERNWIKKFSYKEYLRVVNLQNNTKYIMKTCNFNPQDKNCSVLYYFQIKHQEQLLCKAQSQVQFRKNLVYLNCYLKLLEQITKSSAFYYLRTKEQLGYIVFSGIRTYNGVKGFYITVQSSKFAPKVLKHYIELYIQTVLNEEIEKMENENFESRKQALIASNLVKNQKLSEEMARIWPQIETRKYFWNILEEEVEFFGKEMNKEQFIQFWKDNFLHQPKVMIVEMAKLHGEEEDKEKQEQKQEETQKKEEENVVNVDKKYTRFRRNHALHPVLN